MFFIVYLLSPKFHIVIPVTWIFDYEKVVQKFIRKAVNSNQKHLIFYSKKTLNGIPDGRIDANFSATKKDVFPFVGEQACFIGQITHYYSKIYSSI